MHRHTSLAPPRAPEGVQVLGRVRQRLVRQGEQPSWSAVLQALAAENVVAGADQHRDMAATIQAHCAGLGVLQPLLQDERISDIVVNGPDQVYVDRGQGLEHTDLCLPERSSVHHLAVRLAHSAGKRLDPASPWVDAQLPQGIRLHAVMEPIADQGTLISLRIPARTPFTLAQLVECDMLTPAMAMLLEKVMQARLNVIICGGTGSGKTTFLGTLLGLAAPNERLLLVEDISEIAVDHSHVVRLRTRAANAEGVGAVSLQDLVRQGLRMRPDRLVVGEVRGADVVDLLNALNTGHQGGCATIHANSAADVPARLEALAALAGMSREALHSQLASALDVVVALRRDRDGFRRVSEIGLLVRRGPEVVVESALTCAGAGPAQAALLRRIALRDVAARTDFQQGDLWQADFQQGDLQRGEALCWGVQRSEALQPSKAETVDP